MTLGCALIMGRKTFESLPVQLKGRRVIMVTRQPRLESKFTPDGFARDLEHALQLAHGYAEPVWIAGGGQVYVEVLAKGFVDFIDMTVVPRVEHVSTKEAVRFPLGEIEHAFRLEKQIGNKDDPRLGHQLYVKR